MTTEETKLEVATLLSKRQELRRLGLELPPDQLMLLKRLLYRLGWTSKMSKSRRGVLHMAKAKVPGTREKLGLPPEPTPSDLVSHAGAVLDNPRDDAGMMALADHVAEKHGDDPHAQAFLDWVTGRRSWNDITPRFQTAVVTPRTVVHGQLPADGGAYVSLGGSERRTEPGERPPGEAYNAAHLDTAHAATGRVSKRHDQPYWVMRRPAANVRWYPDAPETPGGPSTGRHRKAVDLPGTKMSGTEVAQWLHDSDGLRSLLLAVVGSRHFHPDTQAERNSGVRNHEVRFTRGAERVTRNEKVRRYAATSEDVANLRRQIADDPQSHSAPGSHLRGVLADALDETGKSAEAEHLRNLKLPVMGYPHGGSNGAALYYKLGNYHFPIGMDLDVAHLLTNAYASRAPLYVHSGVVDDEPDKGRDRLDERNRGTVGFSTGSIRYPLLLRPRATHGDPITNVVRIRGTAGAGYDWYRHPDYHHGEVTVGPGWKGVSVGVYVDGKPHAGFADENKARSWVKKMGLTLTEKPPTTTTPPKMYKAHSSSQEGRGGHGSLPRKVVRYRSFEEKNNKAKNDAQRIRSETKRHIKRGQHVCRGCWKHYHVIPRGRKCRECGGDVYTVTKSSRIEGGEVPVVYGPKKGKKVPVAPQQEGYYWGTNGRLVNHSPDYSRDPFKAMIHRDNDTGNYHVKGYGVSNTPQGPMWTEVGHLGSNTTLQGAKNHAEKVLKVTAVEHPNMNGGGPAPLTPHELWAYDLPGGEPPPAKEVDWRPQEVLPEDFYAMGRTRTERPRRYMTGPQDLLTELQKPEYGAHMAGLDNPLQGLRGVAADHMDEQGRHDEATLLRERGRHVIVHRGRVVPSFMERQGISSTYGGPETREQFVKPTHSWVDPTREEGYDPVRDAGDTPHHSFTYWFAQYGTPQVYNPAGGGMMDHPDYAGRKVWWWNPADGEGIDDEDIPGSGHENYRQYQKTEDLDTPGTRPHLLTPSEKAFMNHHATTPEFKRMSRLPRRVVKYAMTNRSNFIDALRRIKSSNQKAMREVAHLAAKRLGLAPTKVLDALHDTPHGSVPGVAQAVYGPAPTKHLNALGAWLSLSSNTPGYAVFHARPTGPDTLYRVRVHGSGADARSRLDRLGIRSRVMIPHAKGFDVLVPDKGNNLGNAVGEFARIHGTVPETSRGHLEVVGIADQGQARDRFRTKVVAQERM